MKCAEKLGLVVPLIAVLTVVPLAQAQTFTVLHAFTGGADGANPGGVGVSIDAAGNLYGGAGFGGLQGSQCYFSQTCGTIFKLNHKGSSWTFNVLYSFHGGDGATPDAPVVLGPDGTLYGTTFYGAGGACFDGCGNVFRLQPPATACKTALCPWTQTVLYNFTGGNDGAEPAFGALTFDGNGNIYGTSTGNETGRHGNVFELSPDNGQWNFQVLYSFTGYVDGGSPWSGVIFDAAGNLYGTTTEGGADEGGTAYALIPSSQGWSINVLHQFAPSTDGAGSFGNLIFDDYGNLLGTNRSYGPGGAGTAFELSPSNNGLTFSLLHSFTGSDSVGPQASLLLADAGNTYYGTTVEGGQYGWGTVFKLTASGDTWVYTDLHDFTGGTDGGWPYGQIVMDANGNLYGGAELGGITGGDICGSYGCGVVWEMSSR